ncbi:unnamed protein product [Ectocarpus sp. 8 AP-2014]
MDPRRVLQNASFFPKRKKKKTIGDTTDLGQKGMK